MIDQATWHSKRDLRATEQLDAPGHTVRIRRVARNAQDFAVVIDGHRFGPFDSAAEAKASAEHVARRWGILA